MSDIKNVSVAKIKARGKEGPAAREKRRRGGQNVIWRRITASYDEDLKRFGANPAMVSPITRWVLFNHLTKTQGMAGRRYGDIVRGFDRFHANGPKRQAKSADLEPTTNRASDTTIERHIQNGTIEDYEDKARYARRQMNRLLKVLARYTDPITGRNPAKEYLDQLCLEDKEPPSEARADIAAVLSAVAKEFGLGERQRKIKSWRAK